MQTRYSSGESPSEVIIRALAVVEDVEPTELELLYESIDPEALDALLGGPVIDADSPTTVEFGVSDYRVVASSDGQITILAESAPE